MASVLEYLEEFSGLCDAKEERFGSIEDILKK